MTSFSRKLKRKQKNKFFKDFKKKMKNLKDLVKCSICGRPPEEDEKVDNWYIKAGTNLLLSCPSCRNSEKGEE